MILKFNNKFKQVQEEALASILTSCQHKNDRYVILTNLPIERISDLELKSGFHNLQD